jgi:hypothetical protein
MGRNRTGAFLLAQRKQVAGRLPMESKCVIRWKGDPWASHVRAREVKVDKTGQVWMGPKGVLFDYGGTLVEEVSFDPRAGNEWLFSRASHRPPHVTVDDVLARANRISTEVAGRRDQFHIETAWPALTRLIHDFFGIRFDLARDQLLERAASLSDCTVRT